MTRRPLWPVLAAFLMAACATEEGGPAAFTPPPPPPPGPPPVITLQAPAPLWAGSEIVVSSPGLAGQEVSATTLRLGTIPIPLTRRDATTLVGVVPSDMLSAGVVPQVTHLGVTTDFPLTTVYGFASRTTYPLTIPWDIAVLSDPVHAKVIAGYSGSPSGLVIIDLDTRTIVTVPGVLNVLANQRGPGETRDPGVWLLREPGASGDAPMHRWRLTGTPTDLGVVPAPSGLRQIAQLDADLWLTSTHHTWTLGRLPAGAEAPSSPTLTGDAEEIAGIHLSTSGTRATFRVNRMLEGVPVFDVVSGTIAYRTAFTSVQGVSFLGTQLLMAGGDNGPEQGAATIRLLQAADGQVLASAATTMPVSDVALDPRRPYAYVLVNGADGIPMVEVRDRTTLALKGTLKVIGLAGSACGPVSSCFGGKLVVSPGTDGLYYFWAWNGQPRAYRFALPAP